MLAYPYKNFASTSDVIFDGGAAISSSTEQELLRKTDSLSPTDGIHLLRPDRICSFCHTPTMKSAKNFSR